jgi:O-antigen/teichoic acid export membrane protein
MLQGLIKKGLKRCLPTEVHRVLTSYFQAHAGQNTRELVYWVLSIAPFYVLSKVITFGLQAVAARLMGPSAFGDVNVIQAVAAMITIPMQLGFAVKVSKFVPIAGSFHKERECISSEMWGQLLWILVCLPVFWLCAPFLAGHFKLSNPFLYWAAAYAVALTLYTYFTNVLVGLKEFKKRTLADFIYAMVFAAVFTLIVFWMTCGTNQYMCALLAGSLAASAFALFWIRKWVIPKLDIKIVLLNKSYIAAPVVNSLFSTLFNSLSPMLLAYYLATREVGIYSVYAMGAITVSGVASGLLTIVLFPMTADPTKQKGAWRKFFSAAGPMLALLMPFFMAVIFVILHLVGKQYPIETGLLVIFAATGTVNFMFGITMTLLGSASGHGMWMSVAGNVLSGITMLALALLLIPAHGIAGAGLALLGSRLVGLTWCSYSGIKHILSKGMQVS